MRFFIKPNAKQDIKDATLYYKKINTELAKQFTARIKEIKKNILSNPSAFQVRYRDIRIVMLEQFPYAMHYSFDTKTNNIILFAVVFQKIAPQNYLIRK